MVIALGCVAELWRALGPVGIVVAAFWGVAAGRVLWAVADRVGFRVACVGAAGAGVIALAAFAVVHPRVDVEAGYRGTDRDEDADIAVRAGFDGEYPFAPRTYLGNRVTHLPGSLLVAAPFVAVGSSALENLVVVPVGIALLARRTRSARAVVLTVGGGVLCTSVWHEWLTGGNSLAEMVLIVAAGVWLAGGARSNIVLRAAAFGVALCARANTLVCGVGPIGSFTRRDWRRTAIAAATVATTHVVLIGPFLLGGYERFTPLSSARPKFAHLTTLFASADTVAPIAATVVAALVGLAVARRWADAGGVAAAIGVTQFAQFGLLAAISALAGSAAWAESWTNYFVLGVVPALAAFALADAPT